MTTITITNTDIITVPAASRIHKATRFLVGVAAAGALAFGLAGPAVAAQGVAGGAGIAVAAVSVTQAGDSAIGTVTALAPSVQGRRPGGAAVQGFRGP